MGTIREAVLTVGVFAALGALIVLLWLGDARAGDIVGTVRLAGAAGGFAPPDGRARSLRVRTPAV